MIDQTVYRDPLLQGLVPSRDIRGQGRKLLLRRRQALPAGDGLGGQLLAPLAPRRFSVSGNNVEFSVKADEARVLALVAELAKRERVLRVEVSGASLEDIFVELMK
ncbi:MAG: hypothetical protein M1451_06195 [Acidobacteria bacterium]|nr:hypothetical protein [Acidobacteriota bacterium]